MKNKKYLVVGAVAIVVVILIILQTGSGKEAANSDSATSTMETTTVKKPSVSKPKTGAGTSQSPSTLIKTNVAPSGYPEIEFIDKVLSFPVPNYDRVNVRVQKVAFGRGDAAQSTGCKGVPNTNFASYLYPGDSICIGSDSVDGASRGILALHMLIENNGSYNFGGNAKTIELHYLRANADGVSAHRFAYPLNSLAAYNITPYNSREVILSYLVPEDQTNFDLLFDYKGTPSPDLSQNVYGSASGGLFINFSSKSISLIK